MQSYLLIGADVSQILKKIGAKPIEFELRKIEDTRELNKFSQLSVSQKTAFIIRDVEKASIEALNAFLKNLEEPKENIYFILTTQNKSAVLPTIVSRCQVVKSPITIYQFSDKDQLENFHGLNNTQKLEFVSKIKDRSEAVKLVEDLIYFLHDKEDFTNMELLLETLTRLNANGNVNLQLSNLAINFRV